MAEKILSIGTIFLSRGRYYWRGILPGETERKTIPLRPVGAKYATKDPSVANLLAIGLIDQATYQAQKANKPVKVKTIPDLVRSYLAHAKTYYKSNEPKNIEYALDFLVSKCPGMAVEDFGPLVLKAVRKKMIQEKDWTRGVINQRISMIVRMFKWGVSEQLVPVHVYQSLAAVESLHKGRSEARESKRVRPVPDAHWQAILPYLSQTVADMVRIQRLTGMRSNEVCVIRPVDIDRSGEVWIYTPSEYKGEHLEDYDRKVALGPQAQAILCKYLFGDSQGYCFTPARAEAERGRQPAKLRSRYDKDSYRLAVTRAIGAANRVTLEQCKKESPKEWEKLYRTRQIPHWHPHQLRHTHATEIAAAESVETAKAALGHKRLQTTEIYAEKDMRRAIEAAKKYG